MAEVPGSEYAKCAWDRVKKVGLCGLSGSGDEVDDVGEVWQLDDVGEDLLDVLDNCEEFEKKYGLDLLSAEKIDDLLDDLMDEIGIDEDLDSDYCILCRGSRGRTSHRK